MQVGMTAASCHDCRCLDVRHQSDFQNYFYSRVDLLILLLKFIIFILLLKFIIFKYCSKLVPKKLRAVTFDI